MVAGTVVVACIVAYIYREVIIHTLIMAGIAVGIVCGLIAIVVLTVNFLRWSKREQHKRVNAAIEAGRAAAAVEAEPIDDEKAKEIAREADWLASGVELAFDPDGKLKAKKGS
jgi:hypothetical protein